MKYNLFSATLNKHDVRAVGTVCLLAVLLIGAACAGSSDASGDDAGFVPYTPPVEDAADGSDGVGEIREGKDSAPGDSVEIGLEADDAAAPDAGSDLSAQDLPSEDSTVPCQPDCTGKECGDDGCGQSCGKCPEVAPLCVAFKCALQCNPDCEGKECGNDGCDGECGQCPQLAPLCMDHLCQPECTPDCANKQCGDNGCGGECGACPENMPLCQDGLCLPVIEDGCTEEGKQVFLVTESNMLIRFEPLDLNLVPIGALNCNANFGETPYSMSVDRNSFAWVLYGDGTLWKVNTEDASCAATGFAVGQQNFEIFGMGFSTDAPGITDETLYIAGGSLWEMMLGSDATIGSINLDNLSVNSIASLAWGSGLPELTGNRSAELWGFFAQASPPRIARIDKTTAAQSQTINLPAQLFANVQAWAFAYWGGSFYIFFKSNFAGSSGIWRVLPDGQVVTEVGATGHVITGAGVSTCAPTE